MRTEEVIALFNNNAASVARFLNITRAAVDKWPDEVPLLRQYQLRERWPGIDDVLAAMRNARIPRGKRRNEKRSK